MVSGLLSIDLVILLTWQLSDPLQRRLEHFALENPLSSSDDIKILPELEHCESENNSIWLGRFYTICNSTSTRFARFARPAFRSAPEMKIQQNTNERILSRNPNQNQNSGPTNKQTTWALIGMEKIYIYV